MAGALVPEDDLYARLEVEVDASPEAIELAWRALLKRHHPDVAGDDAAALERAKRINVAHDWLSDATLRSRYDRERLGLGAIPPGRARTGVRYGRSPRPWPAPPPARPGARPRRPPRPDLVRGDPAQRLARFLDRVSRLTPDELDRLAAAEPPPIAFLATIRRFLTPEAAAAFEAAEAAVEARVPHASWTEVGLREGLLGVAAELVLAPFLDDTLAEPFRGRARDRLLRAWEASIDQPRYGPNGAEVAAVRDRASALTAAEVSALIHASTGIPGDERPWPPTLDPEEDEGLRISALLAARDVAAVLPADGLAPATATRARRLLARIGHVTALRHAFPSTAYASLVEPFHVATGAARSNRAQERPGVRRSS
jgi:curved DNA-binding protein CbpA